MRYTATATLVLILVAIQLVPALTLTTGNGSVTKFRWGNVSMVEVTAQLTFTVSNTTQYQFIIPNSWSVSTALTSTENKLYKIYYIPINPLNPKPNELVLTFKYDIYVAPPQTSTPYDFKTRIIINSPEEEGMPDAMKKVADELFSTAETYYEAIYRATDFTSDYLTYDINYVSKNLSVRQIWELRRGVCRHYAKFEKALLNYAGIQTLYANGFLIYWENGRKEVIPHAWLLVYDPANGWFPVDPTNHNFYHDNDFKTGVVYPFDLLVYAGSQYKERLDYPVVGRITPNSLKVSFKILSVKPLKHLTVYEYRLKNTFSFISVKGAGLLIYHPLKQVFTNNTPVGYYKLLSRYMGSIAEYVPSGYLVPIGFEPYNSRVFLNYYYDVKPLVVPLNASITMLNNTVVFSGFPGKIYLTDAGDRFVEPVEDGGRQLWPVQSGYTMKIDGRYYIPIFGIWYYLPPTIGSLKNVSVEPIAVYGSNGLLNVILRIKTTPKIPGVWNLVSTNYGVTMILDNGTAVLSGRDENLTIRIGDRSFTLDPLKAKTLLKITGVRVNVSSSRTVFNLTVKNLDAFRRLNLTLPRTAVINGRQVNVYDVQSGKDWVSFAVPTTPGLLTDSFSIVYLASFVAGHSLLDPSFKVLSYSLKFINPGKVRLIVNLNATTFANITAGAIRSLFPDGLLSVSGNGRVHSITVYEDIGTSILKLSFSTVVQVLGESLTIPVVVDNFNTLRVSRISIDDYSYTNTSVEVTLTEFFTSGSGVADTPTLVLLKTKLRPFAIVNGVAVPYADYYQRGSSLVVTLNIPLSVLKKSDTVTIDGLRLGNAYTVRVSTDYTSPGLVVKGIAPLGGLECSVPYSIEPASEKGSFEVVLDIHSVGETATCRFGGREYTITPQYTGVVSFVLSDTDRIDDVASNGRGVYAGYTGVFLTVTTTQPPAFGKYKLVVDNETLAEARLTSITVKLPPLKAGRHVLKLYDGDFLVWKGYLTVYPQPLTLKLLHKWPVILVVFLVLVGALLSGVISTEPYTVSMARKMLPNCEFVQHTKRGKWEVVVMYDPMTGEYVYVYFFDKRFQGIRTARD